MRTARNFLISLLVVMAGWAQAQDNNANANVVFARAVQIYTDSQSLDEAGKKEAAKEVLRLFDLILAAYPESIPGQRIKAGNQVGPIDMTALRALAGVPAPAESPAPALAEAPETEAAPEVLEWYQRVLPSGTPEGGFGHGQFPSVGQRTHPGTDLIAACDVNITAPVDASVVRAIKAGDPAFVQTGNALVLRSGPSYLAYFFLGAAPMVSEGDVEAGQVIGTTGPLHESATCGAHFEVRRFDGADSPILPLWHNVLAVGDWRDDPAFKTGWRDPKTWLSRLDRQSNAAPLLLAERNGISVYFPRFLGQFNRPTRLFSRNSDERQGLDLDRAVVLSRTLRDMLRLDIVYLYGRINPRATENIIAPNDRLSFRFRVKLLKRDAPEEATILRTVLVNARLANGTFNRLTRPASIMIAEERLKAGDALRFELVGNDGRVFPLGEDISLEPLDPEEADLPDMVEKAAAYTAAFDRCLGTATDFSGTMTYGFYAPDTAPEKVGNLQWLDYDGLSRQQANALDRRLRQSLENCTGLTLADPEQAAGPATPLEIVFGRPAP